MSQLTDFRKELVSLQELYMIKYIFAKRDTLAIQYHIKNWRLGVFGEEGLSPYHQITQPLGS